MRRNILALGLTMPWLAGCSTTGLLSALTRFSGRVETDLPFGEHPRQRLDVYHARSDTAPGGDVSGVPTAIFYYGGSWNRGARGDYAFVGKALASRGITTVIADYRLYPEVRYPDFLSDCALAAAWTLNNTDRLGGDRRQVYVMGHSAGAYNAAMMALDPRWLGAHGAAPSQWAGWIGLAGPYEFLPITNPDAQPVFHHPSYPAATQPIEHASARAPRTLLITAIRDELVNPVRNSAALARRLDQHGVSVRHERFERVDHMTLIGALASPLRWLAPVADSIVDFIKTDAPS